MFRSEMWRVDGPCRVNSTRLGVEESSLGAVGVEANDESTDTERTDTTRLSVALLNLSDVLCDVFDWDGILNGQTMTLGFQASLVDKDAGVGVETSKGEADVVVDETNLWGSDTSILELHGAALLTAENNDLVALDTDGACSWEAISRPE
jgi:hypothetical protein